MAHIKSNWVQPDFNKDFQSIYKNIGLLILRGGIASMMLFGHGFEKLVNFTEIATHFPDPLGVGPAVSLALAIFAEFFCSLAIAFGLLTRVAVIPLIATMLISAFAIHGDDPWQNKELAMIYLVLYITLLFTGAGKYAVDHLWFGRNQ